MLANLVFLVVHLTIKTKSEAFLTWGWRLPFLFSAVLVAVAFFIRSRVDEPPQLSRGDDAASGPLPIADLLRRQWREVLLGAGVVTGVLTLVYETGTFFTHYASEHLHYSKDVVLLAGVAGAIWVTDLVWTIVASGDLSGRSTAHQGPVSIGTGFDSHSNTPLLSLRYTF